MSTGLRIAGAIMGAAAFFPAIAGAQPAKGVSFPQPKPEQPSRGSRETYALGVWRLRIERDAFSGIMRCTLDARDGRLFYQPGAIGFAVGGKTIFDALIRIDNGNAVSFRDLLPELAKARVRIGGRDMDRPTDGLVWMPVSRLASASSIAIQPRFGGAVRRYKVQGLERLIAYAGERGCVPEGSPRR